MSLWKYFKRAPPEPVKKCEDKGLPEPTGPLSKSVPAKAIELANAQVKKVQLDKTRDSGGDSRGKHSRPGGPYLMLTPAQRYEIGKGASEHGTTNTMRYYARKYPQFKSLKESSVRRFKNLYQATQTSKGLPLDLMILNLMLTLMKIVSQKLYLNQ